MQAENVRKTAPNPISFPHNKVLIAQPVLLIHTAAIAHCVFFTPFLSY